MDAARRAAMRGRCEKAPETGSVFVKRADVLDLLVALEASEAECARLREALTTLTEQAASYVADYPTWNVVWRGGSTKGMIAAVAQAHAALGEAAPAGEE
jgi:hypothetical protein